MENESKNQGTQPDAQPDIQPNIQPTPENVPIIAPEVVLPKYKPQRNPKIVATIAGGVIAVVIVIGLAIFLSIMNKQAAQIREETPVVENEEKTEIVLNETQKQALVKNVLSSLRKIEQLAQNEGEIVVQDVYDADSPYYLATGAKVAMPLERSFGLSISLEKNPELKDTVVERLEGRLKGMDFEVYEEVYQTPSKEEGWLLQEEGIICGPIVANNALVSISCGHTSWVSAEEVALGNGLAEAYKKVNGDYPYYIAAKASDIKDSPYRPYQKVIATTENGNSYFYRPSSTGSWVYFKTTDSTLTCDDFYSDSGAKHAFQGDTCLDKDGQETTVKETKSADE